jgi:hypothetical protein
MPGTPRKVKVGSFRVVEPGRSVEDDPGVASVLRRGRRHLRGLAGRPVAVADLDEEVRRGYHRPRGGGGIFTRGASIRGPIDDED